MEDITAQELKELLDAKEDVVVVNVLMKSDFDREHIPGSLNIPIDKFHTVAEATLPDKNKKVVVHCSDLLCTASDSAADLLERAGYKNVLHLASGMQGWKDAGFKVESSLKE